MNIIFIQLTLVLSLVLAACSSKFEAETRPFTKGTTSGDFVPVLPKEQAVPNNSTSSKMNERALEADNAQFSELKFNLELEDPLKDGKPNLEALIKVSLTGQMTLGQSHRKINLKLTGQRYTEEGLDRLELKKEWGFRLVNQDKDFVADIMCTEKWDCKTVLANLYWYNSEGHLDYRQYHVLATVQSHRQEESPSATNSVEHNHRADEAEVSDIDTVEMEPNDEPVSGYGFTPFRNERFILISNSQADVRIDESQANDNNDVEQNEVEHSSVETVSVEEQEESAVVEERAVEPKKEIISEGEANQDGSSANDVAEGSGFLMKIIEDIVDLRSSRPDRAYSKQTLALKDHTSIIELRNLVFDFKSEHVPVSFAEDMSNQSIGCHSVEVGPCKSGGRLKHSTPLELVRLEDIDKGTVPFAIQNSGDDGHYGAQATINLLEAVTHEVFLDSQKTTIIGDISLESGGTFPGHKSHQNGLDIDLSFFTYDNKHSYSPLQDNFKNFDTATNYLFLKELFSKAKVYDEANEQAYSYILVIAVDNKIKKHLCDHARKTEPALLNDSTSDVYQMFRRIKHWSGHDNHYHIRLSCHSTFCRDVGYIQEKSGCEI